MRTVEVENAGPVAELLRQLQAGEEVVLTEHEIPSARLVRLAPATGARRFGFAKGLLRVHDDFDAPLDDVEPYIVANVLA